MKDDARRLPAAAQEEKRKQAVRMWKRQMPRAEIAEQVGVHTLTVGKWIRLYQAGGLKALRPRRRGRRDGVGRQLSPEQERGIQRLLIDKTPDQLKLKFALWTRMAVGQLIHRETRVRMPIRTVGDYLKRWGFTVQKPKKQAYEQRPAEVGQWLQEIYPAIQARAKREQAEIYWGDETGLRTDSQHARGYAPKGKTPVLRLKVNRESLNMISAVTNQGKVRFRLFEGSMNAKRLIEFMNGLIKDAKRKVILILDNLRVHHARPVKDWVAEHQAAIEVCYLPAYSPELNPDEYLNCDLKHGVHTGIPARSKQDLKNKTLGHMRKLQKTPTRVRKYFEAESIRYAA